MLDTIKKINSVLRIVFIGFVAIYGVVKIFDVVPRKNGDSRVKSADRPTSEFDEIW